MRKIVCIIIAIVLVTSTIGCSYVPADGDIREPIVDSGKEGTDDDAEQDTESEEKQPSEKVSISETVLLDEAGVKITAKSIDTESFWGTELKLLIENNTEKNLTVQVRDTSVNGFMVNSSMSASVAAGKKANDTLTFMSSDLESSEISDIAQMEIYFHIFDTDTWDGYFDSDKIVLETSIADTFDYSYEIEGITVYEGNGITVKAKGVSDNDSIFGPGLILCIYNANDRAITVQTRDESVNGFMISSIFSSSVLPQKYAIDAVTFFESDLEDNGIEKITEIEISLHIYDSESWGTIIDTDPITLTFE